MHPVFCFPPIADAKACALILGSMPGKASLEAGQYYAHPHNRFWPIMSGVTGIKAKAPYTERAAGLRACGIALWDVLKSCYREGSLDSSIDLSSIKPNDFCAFFRAHRRIRCVYFNGGMAERCYRKYVLPSLDGKFAEMETIRLPSTSPANASWTPERKRQTWHSLLNDVVL